MHWCRAQCVSTSVRIIFMAANLDNPTRLDALQRVEAARIDAERMSEIALRALADAKGVEVRLLDVRQLTDITDYMIVATGTSERHIKTLAERVVMQLRAAGWRQLSIEGEAIGDWVLVDFVDIVVHIMRAATRAHYDLESLWDSRLADVVDGDGGSDDGSDSASDGASDGDDDVGGDGDSVRVDDDDGDDSVRS